MGRNLNLACVVAVALGWALPARSEDAAPRAPDARLSVKQFAGAPEIVHPIAMTFDRRGRLLVIESHTHFRPDNYQGPKFDRVRILEDTDGDGTADKFGTYFEGTTFTMDIAAHPDGTIYLATRNEILRLLDRDNDGKAEDSERIVHLETAGNYPHNGLSGLAFDANGDLMFGIGENLGANYTLHGSDGTKLTGGGEGGNIYHCTATGKQLRRVATGFWNPFGIDRDAFGRVFAIDNDPDSMPPCRLVQVVEGGDYGYQFRYGRSGRHVFQCWNGELPGTLPMVSGVGEAPCEVVCYESDGLPREYVGNLLVTSWAEHRVERYVLKERGASVTAEMQPLVLGGKEFRPVGLTVAPDGSLFFSDWVRKDYALHGQGAVWHLRWNGAKQFGRQEVARRYPLHSADRSLREAAALAIARSNRPGLTRSFRNGLYDNDSLVRATCLDFLIRLHGGIPDLLRRAERDREPALRAVAVRGLVGRGEDVSRFLDEKAPPAVRREAIGSLKTKEDVPRLLALMDDPDPFLRSAAVLQLSRVPDFPDGIDRTALKDARQRIGLLLACRASGRTEPATLIPEFLADPDEDVRFLAAKWISDEKLTAYRPLVVEALQRLDLNVRMYTAYSTALARLDNQDVSEARMATYFVDRLEDADSPPELRIRALQLVPPTDGRLTIDLLTRLLGQDDAGLRLEAVRTLCEHPNARRFPVLLEAARNPRLGVAGRAEAIVGLAEHARDLRDDLLSFVQSGDTTLRDEALRALIGVPLTPEQTTTLNELTRRDPRIGDLAQRVLTGTLDRRNRPPADDLDAWFQRLEGPADPDAGRRAFFHPKLAGCFHCHRVDGRGRDVGPDLSTIGRTDRRRILESIVQPGNAIGPSYQNWQIATTDGKIESGMLVHTNLDEQTYLDAKGNLFKLTTPEIAERRALPTSIMPTGLPDLLTDQELRDLLAYLGSRR